MVSIQTSNHFGINSLELSDPIRVRSARHLGEHYISVLIKDR